jgi:ATP-binding cassette, subfamily B, bacterial
MMRTMRMLLPGRTRTEKLSWTRLRPLLGDRRSSIVILVVASVLCGITESGILAILAQSAVALVDRASRVHVALGPLDTDAPFGTLFVLAILLAVGRVGLQGVVSVVPARIVADLQARMRQELFAGFTRSSWAEQARDREGLLQELLTNQMAQASNAAVQATQVVVGLAAIIVLAISALAMNALAALLVLGSAVGLFALLRPLSILGRRRAQAVSRAAVAFAGGVSEAVRVAEEAQVFGVGEAQRTQLDELIEGLRIPFFHTQILIRLVPGLYQSLIYLLVIFALIGLYATGAGHVASLGAVVLLLVRAGTYGQQVQTSYQWARQSVPYLDRIQAANERYAGATRPSGRRRLDAISELAFDHVSFSYEVDRPVLSDISFVVDAGDTVGIVGPTGAGKSTLVQILLGLREPSNGQYLVNRAPSHEFRRDEWNMKVSYLPQQPRLLHATVADNIRFFRDIPAEAVERAARLAGIHKDVVKWPAGYDTVVGPRADAVSGGQQQRICLARALASQPDLLILDEPTSALDPQTELLIRESLAELKGQLTLFVVAHRMSTLDVCERVIVIVDGRLQAFDTVGRAHDRSEYYRASLIGSGSDIAGEKPSSMEQVP